MAGLSIPKLYSSDFKFIRWAKIDIKSFEYIKPYLNKTQFHSGNSVTENVYTFSYNQIENFYLTYAENKIEEIKKCQFKYVYSIKSDFEIKLQAFSELLREISFATSNKEDKFFLVL